MNPSRPSVAAAVLAASILGLLAAAARGGPNTGLKVQIGWGEKVRAGHWTPVFIQATDPNPRAAVVEINAAQGSLYSMQVRQYFTIGPVPSTLTLYVPIPGGWGDGPTVNIREEGGKTMARYPPDPENNNFYQHMANGNARFIGVSGMPTSLQVMQGQSGVNSLEIAYLDPELLPEAPIGYDSLELLVLNEPDLLHLRGEQQQAIVDWVRGGGNLMLWPGDDPAPKAGPLIDALPCTIGGRLTVSLSKSDRARLGLPGRFSGIRGRLLTPRSGTGIEPVDLFGTRAAQDFAYRGSLGLGSILVAPINLSQLQFENSNDQFWSTLMAEAGARHANDGVGIYNNVDPYMRRQYTASQSLEDFLGNVPGAGRFGFSYIALVLLGMMVVVGPIDWFVLRALGRQPWTWVTTTGWIILITGGALFIGHIFKSGKLHYGSVRVIDQADGLTVGETSITGIYSPRTTTYNLDAVPADLPASSAASPGAGVSHVAPAGWWSVVSTEEYGSRGGMADDISFHQTDEGNAPEEMLINVWNLRFLREESMRAGPPMIEANLAIEASQRGEAHQHRLVGVVRNLTDQPLVNIRIRTRAGVTATIVRIEPRTSVNVNTYIDETQSALFSDANAELSGNRYRSGNAGVISAENLWHVAGYLSASRSRRFDAMLNTDDFACIYANRLNPSPPASLREAADGSADQQHYELIRALVPLNAANGATP